MRDRELEKIAKQYGLKNQMNIAQEECAEMIQAISKYRRNPCTENLLNLFEEMADVTIMIKQLEYLLNGTNIVAEDIKSKINRQLQRMKEGK